MLRVPAQRSPQARDPFTQSQPIYGANGRTIPVTIWNQARRFDRRSDPEEQAVLLRRLPGDPAPHRREQDRVGAQRGKSRRRPQRPRPQYLRSRQRCHSRDPHAVTGNVIPLNRLSSQAVNLLKLLPLPNKAAAPNQPNYQGRAPSRSRKIHSIFASTSTLLPNCTSSAVTACSDSI